MWEGLNKRRFPRARCECSIAIDREGKSSQIKTNTENVGLGGICVTVDKKLDLFETVNITLDLDDGKGDIACKGTVMWVVRQASPATKRGQESFDVGIEFISPDKEITERIEEKVSRCLGT